MSYILDALRKAERERQVARVPTLDAAHGGSEPARRRPWPWAVASALALSAVVVYGLWAPGRPEPVREASVPPARSRGEPLPLPAPAAGPPTSGSGTDPTPLRPPVEGSPPRGEPVPGPAAGSSTGRSPAGLEPARPAARRAAVAPPVEIASAAGASGEPDAGPAASGPAGSPAAPESRPAATGRPRPTKPPAASDGAGIAQRRLPGAPVAPPADTLAPERLPEAGLGRATQPGSGEELARLTLDVLVYSDVPAERLVFINGRKYVEGQAVNGHTVLEQITPDGAILRHEDQRIELRPKLNPYARPGSP